MGDLPRGVADNDKELDALMSQLEKGTIPVPEAPARQEMPEEEEVRVETRVDDPAPPEPDLNGQLEKAEQRFKTLEGMMKANQKRTAQVVAELERQLEARKAAEVDSPLDLNSILSEDEQSEFGESGIRVLEKLAGAIATREIAKKALEVEKKLFEMQERVNHAEAVTEGNTTWDLVDRINPGAKEINARDVGWFTFLAEVDPISGTLYREIGEAAAGVNDIQRLSDLIDLYRKGANLTKPTIPVKPGQTPVAPKTDGRSQTKGNKRVYSQDEIRQFYDHRARGVRKGITANLTEAELVSLESDIDAALEDGRISL